MIASLGHGSGSPAARCMIVGECWGHYEERKGAPFVGPSGEELNRMLAEAGIAPESCFLTNVVNAMPPYGDIGRWIAKAKKDIQPNMVQFRGTWVDPIVQQGMYALLREISLVRPNVIVALGNTALWALTGAKGILKWRGSQLRTQLTPDLWPAGEAPVPPIKLIPTIHSAAILREWSYRQAAIVDLRRVAREVHTEGYSNEPQWNFRTRPTFDEVSLCLNTLLARLDAGDLEWIDFDLETRAGHIACAGLSWSATEAICIPFMCVEDRSGYWLAEMEARLVWLLFKVLTHPRVKVRGQNLLYDAQYTYRHWHFVPCVAQDTMIAHHSVFCELKKSLDFQASLYCDHYVYWKDDGKTWSENMSEDQLWVYNGIDCVRTRECGEVATRNIEHYGLQAVDAFQQEMFWPVLQVMQRGVRVDKKKKAELVLELQEEMSAREAFFFRILGHELNPRARNQMLKLFYEDLKQKPIFGKAKPGRPRTLTLNRASLQTLWEREILLRPLIDAIREYRSLGVFLKTFALAPLDIDDRMRTSYNLTGTKNFRLASRKNAFGSGANLQNIPAGDEAPDLGESDEEEEADEEEESYADIQGLRLPNMRKIFVPDEDMTMFDTDLSKADLRIVVWEADEKEMKALLAAGKDPYVEFAREYNRDQSISKKRPDGSDDPRYKIFKAFAHATHYLGTPQGIAPRVGLLVHECDRAQRWYFGRFPRIRQWQEEFKRKVASTRQVENVFGYRRYFFGRIDDKMFRDAISWVPSSTVAIYINKVWMEIYKRFPHIQILLQVHDSLVGQFPTFMKAQALREIAEAGQIVLPYADPLVIPMGVKTSEKSWGDCK